jgi:hypothetical protein
MLTAEGIDCRPWRFRQARPGFSGYHGNIPP